MRPFAHALPLSSFTLHKHTNAGARLSSQQGCHETIRFFVVKLAKISRESGRCERWMTMPKVVDTSALKPGIPSAHPKGWSYHAVVVVAAAAAAAVVVVMRGRGGGGAAQASAPPEPRAGRPAGTRCSPPRGTAPAPGGRRAGAAAPPPATPAITHRAADRKGCACREPRSPLHLLLMHVDFSRTGML